MGAVAIQAGLFLCACIAVGHRLVPQGFGRRPILPTPALVVGHRHRLPCNPSSEINRSQSLSTSLFPLIAMQQVIAILGWAIRASTATVSRCAGGWKRRAHSPKNRPERKRRALKSEERWESGRIGTFLICMRQSASTQISPGYPADFTRLSYSSQLRDFEPLVPTRKSFRLSHLFWY